MLFPNTENYASDAYRDSNGEGVSQNRVFTPVSLPWNGHQDDSGHFKYLGKPLYGGGAGGKLGFGCSGGRFRSNLVARDYTRKIYDSAGVVLSYEEHVVVDVEEIWVVSLAANYSISNVRAVTGTVTTVYTSNDGDRNTSSWLPFGMADSYVPNGGSQIFYFRDATATKVVTYDAAGVTTVINQVTTYEESGSGSTEVVNSSSSVTVGVSGSSSSEFDITTEGLVVISNTLRTAIGSSSVFYTSPYGDVNEQNEWDESQTLDEEFTYSDLVALGGSVNLAVDNDLLFFGNWGGSYSVGDVRGAAVYYYLAGGVVTHWKFDVASNNALNLSYLSRDEPQTKDIGIWDSGIELLCEVASYDGGVVSGIVRGGSEVITLSDLIPEEKKYRDALGVFHKDYLNLEDVRSDVVGEFRIWGGYAKVYVEVGDDIYLNQLYSRERLVCLDGIERRVEVEITGGRFDYDNGVEIPLSETFFIQTLGFVSDWVEEESSTNEYGYIDEVAYTVYVKDKDGVWVEEVQSVTDLDGSGDVITTWDSLDEWGSLAEAKYYVESKYRSGSLWGYKALDSSGGADRWAGWSIVVSGNGGAVVSPVPDGKDCWDQPNISLSYSATSNLDEVTGWFDNIIVVNSLSIGGMAATINGIDDAEGLHPTNKVSGYIAGLGYSVDDVIITPTSKTTQWVGGSEMTLYYRGGFNGNETEVSSVFVPSAMAHPHNSTNGYSSQMMSQVPLDLSSGNGKAVRIKRVTAVGRVP